LGFVTELSGSCSIAGCALVSFAFYQLILSLIHYGEDYDWRELWNSAIALLNFLALKIETLYTTGGVDLLTSEVIIGFFQEMRINLALSSTRQFVSLTSFSAPQNHIYRPRKHFTNSL